MTEVRMIDAEMAKSRIGELCLNNIDLISTTAFDRIMSVIDCCETISPEVRHGRWIVHTTWQRMFGIIHSECSECKFDRNGDLSSWKFCPNCGTRMEGGDSSVLDQ